VKRFADRFNSIACVEIIVTSMGFKGFFNLKELIVFYVLPYIFEYGSNMKNFIKLLHFRITFLLKPK